MNRTKLCAPWLRKQPFSQKLEIKNKEYNKKELQLNPIGYLIVIQFNSNNKSSSDCGSVCFNYMHDTLFYSNIVYNRK